VLQLQKECNQLPLVAQGVKEGGGLARSPKALAPQSHLVAAQMPDSGALSEAHATTGWPSTRFALLFEPPIN